MIREFTQTDLDCVMEIWLNTNLKAHNFIPEEYWKRNFTAVKEMLPQAEIYVYEDDVTCQISGFIGILNNYVAGLFVKEDAQSNGIGKLLLDRVKKFYSEISLNVYQKNERAVSFYLRENFTVQAERIDDRTNEKELLMIWKSQNRVDF